MDYGRLLALPWKLTAADIATPIYTRCSLGDKLGNVDFDRTEPADRPPLDRFAIVEREGAPVGVLFAESSSVGDQEFGDESVDTDMEPLDTTKIISSETRLEELLNLWATWKDQHWYYCVLTDRRATHLLFPHDMLSPPVRMALFAKILDLETSPLR
jgi:hypothetical protein